MISLFLSYKRPFLTLSAFFSALVRMAVCATWTIPLEEEEEEDLLTVNTLGPQACPCRGCYRHCPGKIGSARMGRCEVRRRRRRRSGVK